MANLLLDGVIFIIQKMLLPIMPSNIPFLSLDTYNGFLQTAGANLVVAFSGLGDLFCIDFILTFILVILTAELLLFAWKSIVFILNVFRGSGA